MADSLQRQIRQLEDLSRVQQRFVSDVSHELRTPLTTIRMAGDVLHDVAARLRPGRWRAAAELLQAELDRFEALLADLLEISRFDAGAAVLEPRPSTCATSSHRVVDDLRAAGRAARQRGSTSSRPGRRPASPRSTPGGSSGSCATSSATPSSTARAARSRSRLGR